MDLKQKMKIFIYIFIIFGDFPPHSDLKMEFQQP